MVEKYSCSTCACFKNHPLLNHTYECRLNPPQRIDYGGGRIEWEFPLVSGSKGCVSGWRPRDGRIPHPDQVSLEYWK